MQLSVIFNVQEKLQHWMMLLSDAGSNQESGPVSFRSAASEEKNNFLRTPLMTEAVVISLHARLCLQSISSDAWRAVKIKEIDLHKFAVSGFLSMHFQLSV